MNHENLVTHTHYHLDSNPTVGETDSLTTSQDWLQQPVSVSPVCTIDNNNIFVFFIIMPEVYYLSLNLVVSLYHPHIICIVESWLCKDIFDSELLITGYQLFRFDRNRHGGGVLMYVDNQFSVSLDPTPPSPLSNLCPFLLMYTIHFFMYVFFIDHQVPICVFLIFCVLTFSLLMLFIFWTLYVLVISTSMLMMLLTPYFLICSIFPPFLVCHKLSTALLTLITVAPCRLLI